MSKRKAFWFSFLLSLAVIVPLYLAVFALGITRAKPAEQKQQGIPIAQPTVSDHKTVLVMTGSATAQTPDTYALVYFDALRSKISVVTFPKETIVLTGGQAGTLAQAVEKAGPSQGVAALSETLEISVDNYLFASPETLCRMTEGLGNASLALGEYLTQEQIGNLQLVVEGTQTQVLSPRLLTEILASGEVSQKVRYELRAAGYRAFLQAGSETLANVLPDAVRKNSTKLATNITATEIFDYERIFDFLGKEPPQCSASTLPGKWTGETYELDENSVAEAQQIFGNKNG